MNNKDLLQRFIFENAPIRGEIVRLNESYQRIVSQHQYPPFIQKLLGEMLVAATLFSAVIKFKGRLTVQFQGNGPLKLLLAQSDEEHHIRGLAQWHEGLTEDEVLDVFRKGVLAIIMQGDAGTQKYQGVVSWQGDSLAQSLEGYFRDSEQLPTRLWLMVDEHQASGVLLQMMPGKESSAHEAIFPEIDQNWEEVIHLTNTLKLSEFLEVDNETLLRRLYSHDHEVRVFPPTPVLFRCTCSEKRTENALLLLGQEEVNEELKNKHKIAVTCDFCNKEFIFDRVDIDRIFKQQGDASSSTQVH